MDLSQIQTWLKSQLSFPLYTSIDLLLKRAPFFIALKVQKTEIFSLLIYKIVSYITISQTIGFTLLNQIVFSSSLR